MSLATTRQPDVSMFFIFVDMIQATWSPRQHVMTIMLPKWPF